MGNKLRKHILIISILYLTFSTLISVIEVTNAENENKEDSSSKSFEMDAIVDEPLFFEETWIRTEVNKVTYIIVKSDTIIRELLLTLPIQAQFLDDKIAPEMEFMDMGENRWKHTPSSEVATLRVPVIFKEAGTYEISISSDGKTLIDMGVIVDPVAQDQLKMENEKLIHNNKAKTHKMYLLIFVIIMDTPF